MKGSGADIWGTADEFHYAYRAFNGAASGKIHLTTHVDSVQNVNAWTKAGLMVRASLDPGSMHVRSTLMKITCGLAQTDSPAAAMRTKSALTATAS